MQKGATSADHLLLLGIAFIALLLGVTIIVAFFNFGDNARLNAKIKESADSLCSENQPNACKNQIIEVQLKKFACRATESDGCKAFEAIKITACGTPLGGWIEGETYYLANDIKSADLTCFSISKNNVTIDCTGRKIELKDLDRGILIDANNVILKNCKII